MRITFSIFSGRETRNFLYVALLEPVNKELALLRSELQSRDIAIEELKNEVSAVKATNEELLNANKGLEAKL